MQETAAHHLFSPFSLLFLSFSPRLRIKISPFVEAGSSSIRPIYLTNAIGCAIVRSDLHYVCLSFAND